MSFSNWSCISVDVDEATRVLFLNCSTCSSASPFPSRCFNLFYFQTPITTFIRIFVSNIPTFCQIFRCQNEWFFIFPRPVKSFSITFNQIFRIMFRCRISFYMLQCTPVLTCFTFSQKSTCTSWYVENVATCCFLSLHPFIRPTLSHNSTYSHPSSLFSLGNNSSRTPVVWHVLLIF